ncbi:transcriptional regulator [Longispora fulva]|uniref:DNA-binding HxlR family transcriptional regulator n=1 Tax=Longispora fulva TaxID=619741 RepID=A0A8J7GIS3_9ACTN|nr:helix-turn-helix domain-containing protein [Longispora fulva]MBG6137360.1 DNA-binding HxlR family transcriptional regulator [Longispora fulva]GIG61286.1 transcriptional regulator [Longispora fulva]
MTHATGPGSYTGYCPQVQFAAELIGRRWTAAIIGVLTDLGHARFKDIRCRVPGLSDRLLADRLEELEGIGVVAQCPDAIGYSITEKGRELGPILCQLAAWSDRWSTELGDRPGRRAS